MPEAPSPAGIAAPDDETLVGLARQGNRPACEELFQRHRGVAYRVAFRLLGNEEDAKDAVQNGLIKAFAGLEDFDGRSRFRTWLVRIVSNAAIDLGRKRARNQTFGIGRGGRSHADRQDDEPRGSEPSVNDDPASGLHQADVRRTLDTALARLSPKVRVTFVLFAEAGLSYKEIADDQKIALGTVMSRIHFARQKLQSFAELQGLEDF